MASPFLIFLAGSALIVLFQMWRGWRLGVVRQIIRFFGLAAGWFAAAFGGHVLAPVFRGFGWPEPVARTVGGIALGLLVWLGIGMIGALLFKRTEHHKLGVVRFGFGSAGALLGAAYGLLLVWMLAQGIRFLGAAAEAPLALEKNPRFAMHPSAPGETGSGIERSVGPLVELKRSLDRGITGDVLRQTDPIPGSVQRTLGKTTKVLADTRSMERLLDYPGIKPLLKQPRITELLNDPGIARAVASHDYLALLQHPRVAAIAADPQLTESLRRIDFEKALDYALRKTENDDSRTAL